MKKILILTGEGFEDLELFYPMHRLMEEGFEVHVASNKKSLTGKHGYTINVDLLIEDVNPDEYDALVLPGGKGPERIRIFDKSVEIVKHFFDKGKPVAAICHGPQLLISANVLKGRRLTSYIGIRDDVKVAGGLWEDKEVVVDGNLVTSRHPGDLYAWMREFVKVLK
ncbi:MAG: type 1 glutamine amidotransferase domain-containing protein [Candidatus Njordarchaeia archaeon]